MLSYENGYRIYLHMKNIKIHIQYVCVWWVLKKKIMYEKNSYIMSLSMENGKMYTLYVYVWKIEKGYMRFFTYWILKMQMPYVYTHSTIIYKRK